MTTSLLTHLREVVGLPMGSWYAPMTTTDDETGETTTTQRFVGWTTDPAKAEAAREAGAHVEPYRSFSDGYSGWDITARVTVDNGRAS